MKQSEQSTTKDQLPEHLRDPMAVLARGQAIEKVGLREWGSVDPYERAVRIAEEWFKTDEQRKFLVEIIKLAEQLGGFDHETRWKP
jgi:hypothetical protein